MIRSVFETLCSRIEIEGYQLCQTKIYSTHNGDDALQKKSHRMLSLAFLALLGVASIVVASV